MEGWSTAAIAGLAVIALLFLLFHAVRLRSAYDRSEREAEENRLLLQRAHDVLLERVAALDGAYAARDLQVDDLAARLAQANAELESFSYSISHDLRAPLRSIDGFTREIELAYSDRLDEQGRHYLARVRKAAQRMSELIDDMLDLSRLSRRPISAENVDVSTLAREIAAELQPGRVEFRIADGMVASGDPHLLRIVFENLLGNAVKFSAGREKPVVEVGMRGSEMFVRDNGVGFDTLHSDKLFAPFQRLHSGEFEGTGIGLAIVKRVVHRHGGDVRAESSPGGGATFYFTVGEKSS